MRREVALKVLRDEVDTPGAAQRFATERQALAQMDHPNIARLFDAGSTPEGRSYFAMELVRGVPDPLALMTFKILPNDRPDDEAFARQPVGSGRFMYGGQRTEGGRTYAIFPRNPAYGKRLSRASMRAILVWTSASGGRNSSEAR